MRSVVIDGRCFEFQMTHFCDGGWVETEGFARQRLAPWTLGVHLEALDDLLHGGLAGLNIEPILLARRVLGDIESDLLQAYLPAALWWTSGGTPPRARLLAGWWQLRSCRVKLAPWSWAQRLAAAAQQQGDTRLGLYLAEMAAASVVAIDPPDLKLTSLDAADGLRLLELVVVCNTEDRADDTAALVLAHPDAARTTARVCRALGWTPARVWATPAREIDELVELLDLVDPAPVARSRSLADHPDSVVIRVGDR